MPISTDRGIKVFVYGTLKRSQPNHHWFWKPHSGTAQFISKGRTVTKFPLLVGTKFNVPFLLNRPGTGNCIIGEVYRIDELMLANLDVLEDYPMLYDRERHAVVMDDGWVFREFVFDSIDEELWDFFFFFFFLVQPLSAGCICCAIFRRKCCRFHLSQSTWIVWSGRIVRGEVTD